MAHKKKSWSNSHVPVWPVWGTQCKRWPAKHLTWSEGPSARQACWKTHACYNLCKTIRTWRTVHEHLCLLGVVVQEVNEAGWSRGEDVQEESQVNHHGQREQQRLDWHACPDEHDDPQHGQQAAVQVVLEGWRRMQVSETKRTQTRLKSQWSGMRFMKTEYVESYQKSLLLNALTGPV